jgi:hypothetical protein
MSQARKHFCLAGLSVNVFLIGGSGALTDFVLDVELNSEDEDVRLSAAIDSFVSMHESGFRGDAFDLDLMVRTVLGPGGRHSTGHVSLSSGRERRPRRN